MIFENKPKVVLPVKPFTKQRVLQLLHLTRWAPTRLVRARHYVHKRL